MACFLSFLALALGSPVICYLPSHASLVGGGWQLEYGSMEKYRKTVMQKDPAKHQQFMASLRHYENKRNKDPELHRIRDRKGLKHAQTVDAARRSGREWMKDFDFVEKDVFLEENKDNPEKIDKAKFVFEDVNEDGVLVEGVWQKRANAGYHRVCDTVGSHVEHRTAVDDGKNVMFESQDSDKFRALSKRVKQESSKAEKDAIEAEDTTTAMLNMLKSIGPVGGGRDGKDDDSDDDDGDPGRAVDERSGADSRSDSSDENEDAALKVMGKTKATKPGAKAKMKPATGSAASSAGKATSSTKAPSARAPTAASLPSSSPPQSAQKSAGKRPPSDKPPSAAGSGRQVAVLDGRTENLKKGLNEAIATLLVELEPTKAFDDESMSCMTDETRAKLQEKMKERVKQAGAIATQALGSKHWTLSVCNLPIAYPWISLQSLGLRLQRQARLLRDSSFILPVGPGQHFDV